MKGFQYYYTEEAERFSLNAGQLIAYVGNTGNSTGVHLHCEVCLHGTALDPMQFFQLG